MDCAFAKLKKEDLRYFVFKGSDGGHVPRSLYEQTYEFWKTEWQSVFQQIDPTFDLDLNDFAKQSRVTVLKHQEQILGLQTLNDHQFLDFLEDPYFKNYSVGFLQMLSKAKVRTFQVMKYFLVSKLAGVKQTGLNIPAIILGLSFRQQMAYHFDATITLARKDNASASTARKFEMVQYGCDIEMHNVPVGQLFCFKPTSHPRSDVQEIIEFLWKQRQSYLEDFIERSIRRERPEEFI